MDSKVYSLKKYIPNFELCTPRLDSARTGLQSYFERGQFFSDIYIVITPSEKSTPFFIKSELLLLGVSVFIIKLLCILYTMFSVKCLLLLLRNCMHSQYNEIMAYIPYITRPSFSQFRP